MCWWWRRESFQEFALLALACLVLRGQPAGVVLGGFLTRRFIEYTTAVEIDWSALAQSADAAYEQGGVAGLGDWSIRQRHDGVQATLYQDGQPLHP
ncbi:hypothetical protein, partial [Thermolongibacillus altinsuensis]|uniref:hypothetical protein n=1 Tax=Thermolongibacillus altinsuensis TaxID=575256 RepID=UPI00255715F8